MFGPLLNVLQRNLSVEKVGKARTCQRQMKFRPNFEQLEARELLAGDALQMRSFLDAGSSQQETYSSNAYVATTAERSVQTDQAESAIANSRATAAPGTAQLITPGGTIDDTTPTFRWHAAKNATWYNLYVRNDVTGKKVFQKWIKGQTSYTLTKPLAQGKHSFWVQTYGANIYGNWSAPKSFTIQVAKPDTAQLITPGGTIDDTTPTFRWHAAKNTTWYNLYVRNDVTGKKVFQKWIKGQTSYTLTKPLAQGKHSFWVKTWGNGIYGDWSARKSFTIQGAKPDTAKLIGPDGTISDSTPTFRWHTAKNATWYRLSIKNLSTGKNVFGKWLKGQTAYTYSKGLAQGKYSFQVQTWGNGIYGNWSAAKSFIIEKLATPTTLTPVGNTPDITPTFAWNAVVGASGYDVWVNDLTTGQSQVLRKTNVRPARGPNWTFNSSPLTPGHDYRWWVRAYNGNSSSAWSSPRDFTVVQADVGGTIFGPIPLPNRGIFQKFHQATISSATPDWYDFSVPQWLLYGDNDFNLRVTITFTGQVPSGLSTNRLTLSRHHSAYVPFETQTPSTAQVNGNTLTLTFRGLQRFNPISLSWQYQYRLQLTSTDSALYAYTVNAQFSNHQVFA